MSVYYNEKDEKVAFLLKALVEAQELPHGYVDVRDIKEVDPDELSEYTQCHFFAGIGVWALALARTGWPDDRNVWTGSCPCQPFSQAGNRKGFDDDRHVWPHWSNHIRICNPSTIFGEQVAGNLGEAWLQSIYTDLEKEGYAVGAAVTTAAGFGLPHGRPRLYFVADTCSYKFAGQVTPQCFSKDGQRWPDSPEALRKIYEDPERRGSSWPKPLVRSVDDGATGFVVGNHAVGNSLALHQAAGFIEAFLHAEYEVFK